ncbi:hypothetical protein BH09ACT3_BH09ACT3_08590 [soil metagenome]
MTKRAAIYARISKADKKVPKVENQIALCKALAEDHGYDVVATFEDDGIVASGKAIDDTTLANRPGALNLLEAIRVGEIDVLLAVEGERLARTYLDGLEFIRASAAAGVTWHLDTDGPLDPSTPAGEETAVSIFASGRREGRVRAARQKRRYDRERAAGMPLWGTRPFGYEDNRIALRPSEADLIRKAVTDYLEGTRSMVKIAHEWTDAGVLTDGMRRERKGRDGVVRPARQVWTATTVRQVLQRDRNAGILMYEGVPMPESQIQPIITAQELDDMKARVKAGTPVGARARTLLGGVLRCECGEPMHGTISYSQRKGGTRHVYRLYKCSATIYDKTRRHASIQQKLADDLFIAFILTDIYSGHLTSPQSDTPAALRSITERLTANGEGLAYLDSIVLDVAMKRLHAKARGEMAVLESQRAELESERDVLLSRADESSDFAAFMEEWRTDDSLDISDPADAEAWETRFREAWVRVGVERQQGLIKSRYRPVVKVGGRGVQRIVANPVDPSTFGQPLHEYPDPLTV